MERPHSRFVESLPGDVVAFPLRTISALIVYLGNYLWRALNFVGNFSCDLLQDFWKGGKDAARSG